MVSKKPRLTKTLVAKELGVSRQSLYYKSKKDIKDELLKEAILNVLKTNPSHGYRRLAIALGVNKKRIQRVKQKFNIKPYKRKRNWKKRRDLKRAPMPYDNLVKNICPLQPNIMYASDFTYLRYKSRFYYLATYLDIYTREIVGWEISNKHDKYLVLRALINGFYNTNFQMPKIIHSDQGSEYCSKEYTQFLNTLGIQISMSSKASPWENCYQESFYSNFKTDLGLEFERFETLGEFIEGIHQTINHYNKHRIHTSLKMSPQQFKQKALTKVIT